MPHHLANNDVAPFAFVARWNSLRHARHLAVMNAAHAATADRAKAAMLSLCQRTTRSCLIVGVGAKADQYRLRHVLRSVPAVAAHCATVIETAFDFAESNLGFPQNTSFF